MLSEIYKAGEMTELAKKLYEQERGIKRLDGWFLALETELAVEKTSASKEVSKAEAFKKVIETIPLEVSDYSVFVGTQRDAFARSYALINPSFKVEGFSGYCDPTAVFGDIEPNDELTRERIEKVKAQMKNSDYVSQLSEVYGRLQNETKEVVYFVEQVTGHLIPDFRYAIRYGLDTMIQQLEGKTGDGYRAMKIALESIIILAKRYQDILRKQIDSANDSRKMQLTFMINTLDNVPRKGAANLFEAIQFFILLWQGMCLEQAPNPFAFSVGNADRIFEPYRGDMDRKTASELFKHFLVFFNVGDRSWAISQNILIGGKGVNDEDLTNETSYALLDAYYDMNLPQPILSVKLHRNTPDKLYEELGKFFFTPGVLTPSLFNDDSMQMVLESHGIDKEDLPDISIAGCQEPLIMGKDNGNTTNSWLNLPKILELTLNEGISTITDEQIANLPKCSLKNIRDDFYKNVQFFIDRMVEGANDASKALSHLRVPLLSCFMGGMENGIDVRDIKKQGTKYNGSGCLIHGLSVIADSFIAIDRLIAERPEDYDRLIQALKTNFEYDEELRQYLLSCDKYGNNCENVDMEAKMIAERISDMISSKKNYLGNPFRPDWSSPSTHLLYGYWVGATPDGRKAREMLGYGIDPLYGESCNGLGFRALSNMKLPFDKMNGGYASHFGIDPKYFKEGSFEGKGIEFKNKVVNPLFFNKENKNISPFYLYVNVTTPETLKKVLSNPKKYAPSGVYIMRIHGTFVNFLDLSPAIQQDIIKRLDLKSTAM